MSLERLRELRARYERELRAQSAYAVAPTEPNGDGLERDRALELLESMLLARHLDVLAYELREAGHGHYTISSAGHEGNVVLGELTRPSDPTLVHYRGTAWVVERARHVPGIDTVADIARSLVASAHEPLAHGRHKVLGSKSLGIIPQTSTIASHLPRAVGLGFAIERRERLGLDAPSDRIAVVAFGDASVNHSTALGAFNAAGWVTHQNLKLPTLFVCEDNGLGISVRSPPGWIQERLRALPHVEYFDANGWDLWDARRAAREAVLFVRLRRRPAVLHLRFHRLLGHAGSDADVGYRSADEIDEAIRHDPVRVFALELVRRGIATPDDLLALDVRCHERVTAAGKVAVQEPKLETLAEIRAPLDLPKREHALGASPPSTDTRVQTAIAPSATSPTDALTLAQGINLALEEALRRYPELLIFGEDVAKKGGVYGVTKGLLQKAGPNRLFNTLLDEQTILGLSLGCASLGLLPVPEIQYLAYVHNAIDQLRGEAATMPFFSSGAFDNPMIVRVAGLAYQKGFGGHFHNDNALGALREIPGVVMLVPARADDAIALFRAACVLAKEQRRVVIFLEPIALYHSRDLEPGDGGWLAAPPDGPAPWLAPRMYFPEARDLLLVTFGNGVHLSLRAACILRDSHRLHVRVMDLRFLAPLPTQAILEHALELGRMLVVDETRATGGVAESVLAACVDARFQGAMARVTAADCFIPLGEAAQHVLVSVEEIVAAALALLSPQS